MTLSRLGVRACIFAGCAALIGLALVVAVNAMLGFGSLRQDTVAGEALLRSTMAAKLLLTRAETARRSLLRFRLDSTQLDEHLVSTEALVRELAVLRDELADPAHKAGLAALHGRLLPAMAQRDAFVAATQALVASRQALFGRGDAMNRLMNQMAGLSTGPEAQEAIRAANTSVLLLRIYNWRFLATGDPNGVAQVRDGADRLNQALAELARLPLSAPAAELPEGLARSAAAYAADFEAFARASARATQLYDEAVMPPLADAGAQLTALADSLTEAMRANRLRLLETIGTTDRRQMLLAGLLLPLGLVLAWWMSRGIVRPVGAMAAAMHRLAQGETGIQIPSRDARDELGTMAGAVEVFRRNAEERARLEAERQHAEARVEAEKRQALHRLAEAFQEKVGGIIEGVAVAASQMRATAETMSGAARQAADVPAPSPPPPPPRSRAPACRWPPAPRRS
jgi:HAMP domain-containing protein